MFNSLRSLLDLVDGFLKMKGQKMTDYISREAAIEEAKKSHLYFDIKPILQRVPAADVRPVVRGKWYWDKDGMDWGIGAWRCSACKAMSPMWWNCDRGSPIHKSGHRYCPNCGAWMEES